VGTAGWRIGATLSSDALSMAVGVLFGVMAGVPAALLVLAGSRQREPVERRNPYSGEMRGPLLPATHPYLPPQPPVIVVAPQPSAAQPASSAGFGSSWEPVSRPARQFKVVGAQDELVEDW
ncbi:MAG TPA: hypothetical protein VNK95_07900, partial [Caldilineaceae bacterium]|nr:hypothetical protein [Caldilineaceae bacterium]